MGEVTIAYGLLTTKALFRSVQDLRDARPRPLNVAFSTSGEFTRHVEVKVVRSRRGAPWHGRRGDISGEIRAPRGYRMHVLR